MKTFVTLIVGVVLGAAVMHLLCYARQAAYLSGYISHVERPVMMSVQHIVYTYDEGDAALAEAKVRRLEELLHDHYGGGEPTDDLLEDIFNLEIDAAPEPQ